MKDIQTREDIGLLITLFYRRATTDPVIGRFFTEVVHLSLEKHIPVMISFWASILLGEASYKGNAMEKHIALSQLSPIESYHFERWLFLWTETIHENFSGETAGMAISRAASIAQIMQLKIQKK